VLRKIRPWLALAALAALAAAGPAEAQSGKYVVIVNPGNPVTRLSATQVSRIFLGKLQAWSIHGRIQPVAPVDLMPDSPVRAAFTQRVLRRTPAEAASYWRQEIYAGRNVPPPEQSEAEAVSTVRSVLGGIAYVSATTDLKGVKVVSVQ
jgi:ABC-type phosphate transport system substrate-binding protein